MFISSRTLRSLNSRKISDEDLYVSCMNYSDTGVIGYLQGYNEHRRVSYSVLRVVYSGTGGKV